MPKCYKCCKYNNGFGYCEKYDEKILVSKNMAHYGLLIHPLEYLTLYYNIGEKDIKYLIKISEKYLNDKASKNICNFFNNKGFITEKQKKLLLYNIFNCYEPNERKDADLTEFEYGLACQVED